MANGAIVTTGYKQTLKVVRVDIESGKMVAILNEKDARELGLLPMDRAEITNPANGKKINVVVDITDSVVGENEIGIFKDVGKSIGLDGVGYVEARAAQRPKSIEFIRRKMDGARLSYAELKQIVEDIASNSLSEIESTAFVSAVYIRGFDTEETVSMTKALIENGERMEFASGTVVDKHSVGGTNGRTTLIIVPIIAAAGYLIPKTSSRAITSAAGTADAMEVLANVSLPMEKIREVVGKVGGCIAWGGAVELAPADDKIIKVEHPLSLDPEGQVIASVMAKKASVGAKFVVIDLPVGPFVKIKSREMAEGMAMKFVQVGKILGMKVEVLLTNGSEPCGRAFGPALEAKYALQVLEGKFFDNLAQKSVELSGALFELVGDVPKGKGFDKAYWLLKSGKALGKMKEIIGAQGGKIYSSEQITPARFSKKIFAQQSGVISVINVGLLNAIARAAGAPANQKAGVLLNVEQGAKAPKGQLLFEIFSENEEKLEGAVKIAESRNVIEFGKIILEKFE